MIIGVEQASPGNDEWQITNDKWSITND